MIKKSFLNTQKIAELDSNFSIKQAILDFLSFFRFSGYGIDGAKYLGAFRQLWNQQTQEDEKYIHQEKAKGRLLKSEIAPEQYEQLKKEYNDPNTSFDRKEQLKNIIIQDRELPSIQHFNAFLKVWDELAKNISTNLQGNITKEADNLFKLFTKDINFIKDFISGEIYKKLIPALNNYLQIKYHSDKLTEEIKEGVFKQLNINDINQLDLSNYTPYDFTRLFSSLETEAIPVRNYKNVTTKFKDLTKQETPVDIEKGQAYLLKLTPEYRVTMFTDPLLASKFIYSRLAAMGAEGGGSWCLKGFGTMMEYMQKSFTNIADLFFEEDDEEEYEDDEEEYEDDEEEYEDDEEEYEDEGDKIQKNKQFLAKRQIIYPVYLIEKNIPEARKYLKHIKNDTYIPYLVFSSGDLGLTHLDNNSDQMRKFIKERPEIEKEIGTTEGETLTGYSDYPLGHPKWELVKELIPEWALPLDVRALIYKGPEFLIDFLINKNAPKSTIEKIISRITLPEGAQIKLLYYYMKQKWYLDSIAPYIPEVIKNHQKEVLDYYMEQKRGLWDIILYIPDAIDAHFKEVLDYYLEQGLVLDSMSHYIRDTIKNNQKEVLDLYMKQKRSLNSIAEYIPDAIKNHQKEVLDLYLKQGWDLDSIAKYIPEVIKNHQNEVLDLYMKQGRGLDSIAPYIPDAIDAHFKEVLDYCMRQGLVLDFIARYVPEVIDAHFKEVLDFYMKRGWGLTDIAGYAPEVIKNHQKEVLDFYMKQGWGLNSIASYIPEVVKNHSKEVLDLYMKRGWVLNSIAPYIPDAIKNHQKEVLDLYMKRGWDLEPIAPYISYAIKNHQKEVLDPYMEKGWYLDSIAQYIPDAIKNHQKEVLDLYMKKGRNLDSIAPYIPDALKNHSKEVLDYYMKKRWSLDYIYKYFTKTTD